MEHKSNLLQNRTSEREAGAGAGAEKDDTDAIATTIGAEVARDDTRDGHVRETATGTDDTNTDETTAIADMAFRKTKQTVGNITVVASAQDQGLQNAEDSEVARRETGETERGTATDAGVMIELQYRQQC